LLVLLRVYTRDIPANTVLVAMGIRGMCKWYLIKHLSDMAVKWISVDLPDNSSRLIVRTGRKEEMKGI